MFRYTFILIILSCALIIKGQTFDEFKNTYTPIISYGPLPLELSTTALDKTNEILNGLIEKNNPEYKIQKHYFTTSIFDEDAILKSGNVLFNTKINAYINKIADVLLADNPELRKKLTFYVVRENESNAWAIDNGHIFITLDYIARYNTEAQLAMILCHEISHYLNAHNYKRFVNRAAIIKQMKSVYNNDTLWKKERSFFKTQESQADLEGFDMLLKTKYSIKDIATKFDLMLLSDYSFENIPFDITFFNGKYFNLNSKIFYQEIKPITVDDNYDDTWDTHPNIYKRKKAIEEKIKSLSNIESTGRRDFIVSESDFFYLREMCRFETIKTDFRDWQLTPAVYHSYCLLKKYPENEFLKQIIGNAFYKMAVFKSYSNIHGGFFDYLHVKDNAKLNANRDSSMGHISQIKKMFVRLSGEDFTLLAINYNYSLYKQTNFKNNNYKIKLDTLFNILSKVHNLNYKDFYLSTEEYNKRTIYVSDTSSHNRNYVDAIERKSALLDYISDPEFKAFFKDTTSINEFGIKYIAKGRTKSAYSSKQKQEDVLSGNKKHIQYIKKEIKQVNSIVIQDPYFEKNVYKKYEIESYPIESFYKSERFKEDLIKELNKNTFNTILLNNSKYSSSEIDRYNDIALITNITSENDEQYDYTSLNVFNSTSNNHLKNKFGTEYILQIGVSENIFEGVKFIVNGWVFFRDIKTYDYCFDLVNIESGKSIYRRSFESLKLLTDKLMKEQIEIDVANLFSMKNN